MLINIFRRKPHSPLKDAIQLINQASEIVMEHKHNKQYMPSEKDLRLLEHIQETFHHAYAAAGYVHRCLQQRADGEPEGSKKFTDSEVFDYHYPK